MFSRVGLLLGCKGVLEEDRDDVAVSVSKQQNLAFYGEGIKDGLTRCNQDQPPCVSQRDFTNRLPIVSHRVFGPVQKDFEAPFTQLLGQLNRVSAATGPVVGNEEVVAPQAVLDL